MRHAQRILVILSLACLIPLAAEDYEDQLARTDQRDPDALYSLAMWCKDNQLHRKSRQHLKEIIRIAPDYQPAREALGFLWYEGEWTHFSRVPGGKDALDNSGKDPSKKRAVIKSAGPGPSADAIEWDLTLPAWPEPGREPWLTSITLQMNSNDIYADSVDAAIRTLLRDDNVANASAAICRALESGSLRSLYGPSMIAQRLWESGDRDKMAMAKQILPFLVKASKQASGEQLYFFSVLCGAIGEKRSVPRLIEMLKAGGDSAEGARAGLSLITLIPEHQITPEIAQEWWDRYHSASLTAIYGALLSDANPGTRLKACERLYEDQDKRIMPTLFELLESDDGPTRISAASLLERITGNDWGLTNFELTDDGRSDTIKRLREWWGSEQHRFTFIEFRDQMNRSSGKQQADETPTYISQLVSTDTGTARAARDWLVNKGKAAVPQLIEALDSQDGIMRQKAVETLRSITSQNFNFDPILGSDEAREEARDRWHG